MTAPLLLAAAPLRSTHNVANAQRPTSVRVSADNDAFNFWVPPWARPDEEYTSGVRGSLEYQGPLKWWPWTRVGRDTSGTSRHTFSLGQDIYTNPLAYDPKLLARYRPGTYRPNSAWLFLEAAQCDSSGDGWTELSIAAGVVGRPALGEQMQRFFHSLAPEFNRNLDWHRQLPFEPGFITRYMRSDRVYGFGEGTRVSGTLATEVSGALGTILTEATGGATAGMDWHIGSVPDTHMPIHLALSVGVKGHLIARDELLDGTLFSASESVKRNAFVYGDNAAITLRVGPFAAHYRATRETRRYRDQFDPPRWGTLAVEWRIVS